MAHGIRSFLLVNYVLSVINISELAQCPIEKSLSITDVNDIIVEDDGRRGLVVKEWSLLLYLKLCQIFFPLSFEKLKYFILNFLGTFFLQVFEAG